MRTLALLLPLLAASAASAQAPSETAAADFVTDARLTDALDAAGLLYEVEESGLVRIVYAGIGEARDREQLVLVSPGTMTLADREFREVWALATDTTAGGEVPTKLAARLLMENATVELGAWASENGAVFFRITIPADASADDLAYSTEIVAETADALEAELSDTDEF